MNDYNWIFLLNNIQGALNESTHGELTITWQDSTIVDLVICSRQRLKQLNLKATDKVVKNTPSIVK